MKIARGRAPAGRSAARARRHSAEGGGTSDVPILLRDALGLNIKLVAGLSRQQCASSWPSTAARSTAASPPFAVLALTRPRMAQAQAAHACARAVRARHPPSAISRRADRARARAQRRGRALDRARGTALLAGAPVRRAAGHPARARARRCKQAFMRRASRSAISRGSRQAQDRSRARSAPPRSLQAIDRIAAAPPETLDYMRKLLTNKGG